MNRISVITFVGARPQFIKVAAVSRAISKHNRRVLSENEKINEMIVHTGQHYDHNMSQVFFQELEIPEPHVNLGVGSDSHGRQTGNMLIKIEEILLDKKPDWVLVYGDTNSTLAGALAAAKLNIPIAHVEAGLRSYNRKMPEEHNRVLTDHCSEILFCPTRTAVENLAKEGISRGVHLVGDVMHDSLIYNLELSAKNSKIIEILNLEPKNYALATVHRAENTDNFERLKSIFTALEEISEKKLPVILPLHPRTLKKIEKLDIRFDHLRIIEPVAYLDMLALEKHAKFIFTDSGGVQKEAYWMKAPCITLRNETEWIETVKEGWNVLAGADKDRIVELSQANWPTLQKEGSFLKKASDTIVDILVQKRKDS